VDGSPVAADAVNASAEALPSLLVTPLPISGAGAGDAGGSWLGLLIAAAERRPV